MNSLFNAIDALFETDHIVNIDQSKKSSNEKKVRKNLKESMKEIKAEESATDRYQVREYDGPGASYGVYDTKEKKFVAKGSKKISIATCNDYNAGRLGKNALKKSTDKLQDIAKQFSDKSDDKAEESALEEAPDRIGELIGIVNQSLNTSTMESDESLEEDSLNEAIRLTSIPGLKRDPENDFRDDGNSFKGYIYKDFLPVSALVSQGDAYISIRLDYLDMDYDEYSKLDSYKLTDEFNGVRVEDFNPEKFAQNLETCYNDAKNFLDNVEDVDNDSIEKGIETINKACQEIKDQVNAYIKEHAQEIINLSEYQFKTLKDYIKSAGDKSVDYIRDASAGRKRAFLRDLDREVDYITDNWYFKQIREIFGEKIKDESENLSEDYDNNSWMKYQDIITNALDDAQRDMEDDAFNDFCEGVIQIVRSMPGEFNESEKLDEAEYTANARKCVDAANLLGQIDLKDIEDASKIKTAIEKLYDKLIKLAPKLNKKEQKEIEEASKCKEDKDTLNYKTRDELMRDNGIEFANDEQTKDLDKKADKVKKAFKDKRLEEDDSDKKEKAIQYLMDFTGKSREEVIDMADEFAKITGTFTRTDDDSKRKDFATANQDELEKEYEATHKLEDGSVDWSEWNDFVQGKMSE